jgi:hypothetical protein
MGSVSHYLGLLALTSGRWDDAAAHLEDAMEDQARLGAAPFHLRTRLAYARVLLARNTPDDRAAVGPMLDSIIEEAQHLGMQLLVREAESLRQG